jgi:hypothetical protein
MQTGFHKFYVKSGAGHFKTNVLIVEWMQTH